MDKDKFTIGGILQTLTDIANDIFDDRLSNATFKIGKLVGYLKSLKPIEREHEDGSRNS